MARAGVPLRDPRGERCQEKERTDMRGIILWLLGVPIFVIILLYVFNIL